MEYTSVKEGLPVDRNDCKVIFEDGTDGIAYYYGNGIWCEFIGIPVEKKVISWFNTGGCDSIKLTDQYKEKRP